MAVWGLVWQSGRLALDPALTCARMQPVARAWPARATNGAPREAHELHRSPAGASVPSCLPRDRVARRCGHIPDGQSRIEAAFDVGRGVRGSGGSVMRRTWIGVAASAALACSLLAAAARSATTSSPTPSLTGADEC